jgi:hypothetical protein
MSNANGDSLLLRIDTLGTLAALATGGTNMWDRADEFHFPWRKITGDFIVQARVEFIGEGVDPHREAGIIIRENLDAGSSYVDAALHGGPGTINVPSWSPDSKTVAFVNNTYLD